MSTQTDDLVAMRDVESLYELMTEDDEWLTQFDAAEGLIKLGTGADLNSSQLPC